MKIKRKKKGGSVTGSASSDIAFLLIIYFIVIAGFNINKGFLMDIPKKNSTKLVQKEDILRFNMDSAGDVYFSDNKVSMYQITRTISNGIEDHPNMSVLLTVSPKAPWQSVVSFIETAQRLKVESFSFKMEGAGTGSGGQPGQSAAGETSVGQTSAGQTSAGQPGQGG